MATKFKVPKSLPACADLLKELRDKRYALQHEVDAIKAQEKEVEDHLVESLSKAESAGIAGKHALAKVNVSVKPLLEDFGALWEYARKKNLPELFQRRVNETAVKERWEEGIEVPGVGAFRAVKITLSAIKKGGA